MPDQPPETAVAQQHRLRSGTAARLAGLPVTTLRVWERRYGVVGAVKTDSGQRVYTAHDVSRLRLLRQLTHAGHAIGTIATLELEPLEALANGMPAQASASGTSSRATIDAVVVGRSAAHALEAVHGCVLRTVYDDLDQAEAAPVPEAGVGLLLVRLASLQPAVVDRVLALGAAVRAGAVFVVYAFGTEASAGSLREAGVTVRREPLVGRDLAQWVRDAREAPARASAPAAPEAGWQVAPRRFSDESLARLTGMRSPVACECLRHMAEIVAQLAGFERYSEDCTSTGPADAALHRHLSRTAGAARTLFEQALQRVVDDEGLALHDETIR
jgi:DNA-binding transcriptional MerR regulator